MPPSRTLTEMEPVGPATCLARERLGAMRLRESSLSPAAEARAITVIVADSVTLMREGIAALCEASAKCRVIGQCEDGATAHHLITTLRPDIAVLDLELPRLFAFEIVRRMRREDLPTKAVVLSHRLDRKTVIEALRCGVQAFLPKSGPSRHLLEAFQQVLEGGIYVSPLLESEKIFGLKNYRASRDPLDTLSAREYQVFSLLVEGLRAKEIASRLDLSAKTVDTYRANLMRKLDIHDVAGLVKFAIQRKLTSLR